MPESGARSVSVFPSVFPSVSLVSVCLLDFLFLAGGFVFQAGMGHPHFAICLLGSFLSLVFVCLPEFLFRSVETTTWFVTVSLVCLWVVFVLLFFSLFCFKCLVYCLFPFCLPVVLVDVVVAVVVCFCGVLFV